MLMFLIICESVAFVMLIVILLYDLFGQRLLFSKDVQTEYRAKKQSDEQAAFQAKTAQAKLQAPPPSSDSKEFNKMDITASDSKKA
jgi:hypothetical protein